LLCRAKDYGGSQTVRNAIRLWGKSGFKNLVYTILRSIKKHSTIYKNRRVRKYARWCERAGEQSPYLLDCITPKVSTASLPLSLFNDNQISAFRNRIARVYFYFGHDAIAVGRYRIFHFHRFKHKQLLSFFDGITHLAI